MVFRSMIGSMECLNGMRLLQVFLFKPSEYENIDGELAKTHQTTTVTEYQSQFEMSESSLGLD